MIFRPFARVAACAAIVVAAYARASAATVEGSLPEPGVAWISDGSRPAPLAGLELRNRQKAFVPDVIVATVGSSVQFPNDDEFFHSIYSPSKPDPFDIGFYDNGPGKTVTFAEAGVDAIRCHIHGAMHATIVVVDGPWTQTTAANQRYRLIDVRGGKHVLHEWTPSLGERTRTVDAGR